MGSGEMQPAAGSAQMAASGIADFEMFDDFYDLIDLTRPPCALSLAPYAVMNEK